MFGELVFGEGEVEDDGDQSCAAVQDSADIEEHADIRAVR